MIKYILASSSPRRSLLLHEAGLQFEVIPSNLNEPSLLSALYGNPLNEVAEKLAIAKAQSILENHPCDCIIAADTIVDLDGIALGKPVSDDDARKVLSKLSGHTHKVHTGVCICSANKTVSFSSTTLVTFYKLTHSEIEAYVSTGEYADKAGGYGIQARGRMFVSSINGDYYNVVGLPIARLMRELNTF